MRSRRTVVTHGIVAAFAAAALLLVGTVTPAEASPAERARRTAAATLAEVRAASAVQDVRIAAETKAPMPAAEGTLTPGTASTIAAGALGVSATFSGHKVEKKLSVTVGAAAKTALRAARAERPGNGTPVSDPIEITATDANGEQVTQFPAASVRTRGGGPKGPVVSDVVPGVELELEPDEALIAANSIDPATLRIYTRESDGEPWTALPSYFDQQAGVVRGESTHLSQFVVIGTPFVVPPGPVVVLDPDNDEGHASTPAPPVTELPYNLQLAQSVADMITSSCSGTAVLTRHSENPVSRETRAGIAASYNPALTLGIGFNTWEGEAWGGEHPEQGGTQVYSRGGAADNAVSDSLVGNLPLYTGRPAKNMGDNGNFPGAEFSALPNAFTHLEALYLDNNNDRAFIDGGGMPHLADGVFTALGKYLESQGFDCTDPATGGWPTPPSAAELARWRMLGFQNYLTYGGEPFSFSTGNLLEQEKLFTLPGAGGSETDITLYYNSQDGRLSRVGAGWSFGLGARAQRFVDGSVMVVRADGASFVFVSDGHGGYRTSDPGVHQTLAEAGGGRLKLTDVSGESWVFDAANIDGIGNLVAYADAEGRTTTLTYGAPADPEGSRFVPLSSITDSSGQTIAVSSDAAGRVTGFTRPGGDHWALAYDDTGDLTTLTLPDGRTKRFTYDGDHRLLTATDATGVQYLKNEYDAQGRVVAQWDADGNRRSLDYSKAGQTTYTDNVGRASVYSFDASQRITKVQHPDGTTARFAYDADDNVTASTDENGAKTTYSYDSAGNLLSRTGADGVVDRYTYTPTGQLATKTDAGGPDGSDRTWSYEYDTVGRLTVIHQPDGTAITNSYDAGGSLTKTTKPSGATTAYGYDAIGRLANATDAVGGVTRYAYDAAGRVVSQTDAGGHTTAYAWDSGDRVLTVTDAAGGVSRYEWEPNNHLASLSDPMGATTTFSWDAMFHLTSSTSPTGGVTSYGYTAEDALSRLTDPLGAVTTYTTDEQDRVVKTADPNGGAWSYQYDGVGNLVSSTTPSGARTTYTYDTDGNVLTRTDATGAETRFAYDSVGRLSKQTDADGVSTAYSYDVMDRITRVTDGIGRHSDLGYDVDGNLVSVVDRSGNVWKYAYDAAGRAISSISPIGEATTFGYDADGNVVRVTDPLGRTAASTYDALERLVSTTDAAGNATVYAYDAAGRTTTITDANGHTTAFAYDADGNQTSMTDPLGAVTSYGWDLAGNQTSMTDPKGHRTVYGYDPAGQLTNVIEGYRNGAKASSDVNVTSSYAYDPDGNLSHVTDPNGHVTRYTVDAAGRTLSEVDPVGTTTKWSYTEAGRLASMITGTGASVSYSYDKRGDLSRQSKAGASARYEYDANQQLIAMTDPTGVSGWTYDKDGRVTTQIDQWGGHLATAYDKAGQATSMTLPTGEHLDYTYDVAGRVTSQSSQWGSITYGWDPVGKMTELSRSSGVTSTYGYDADGRVTSVLHTTPPSSSPARPAPTPAPVAYASGDASAAKCTTVAGYLGARSTPAAGANNVCKHADRYLGGRTTPTPSKAVPDGGSLGYQYAYDADGNLAKATRTVAAQTSAAVPEVTSSAYGYDALDRLTSSVTGAGEKNAYAYDPSGNRVGWKRTGATDGDFRQSATFDDAGRLTGTVTSGAGRGVAGGAATYSYDGAGNRMNQSVAGVGSSFAYNALGQPTQVARDGRSTEYAYDGLGRRASVTDTTKYGSVAMSTTYDGTTPLQFKDSQGTTTLIRDAVGALAAHVSASGDATWDLLDGLGSTIAGASGGSITELASYEDWGDQKFESGGWTAPEGYTGHAQDPTLGTVETFARSYDAATGSWTSPDTWRGLLWRPESLGRYQYVENSPVTYFDPDGHRIGDPSAYNTKSSKQRKAMRDADNAVRYGSAVSRGTTGGYAPPSPPASPKKPKAAGPNAESDVSDRHSCPPGQTMYANSYTNSSCVSNTTIKQQAENWGTFFDVLGWIGAAAGLLSLVPGMQWLAPIAMVASAASTIYNCVNGGSRIVGCVIGLVTAIIPGGGRVISRAVSRKVEEWVTASIDQATKALGITGDAFGVAQGWG
ncbi:RHS repeat-associated core domain-containing protein [Leifsonia sp. F6_8S_P_1B]|uniref:RHS repeat-associated core domain-containing protein n=1 Tax=Leifsonia williamsii TaxID=3035919 RepID=A0ABT8KAK7_9MICO|nr:RHS repeat-associated core domain-containing protein [Leifsonia williamsii]MDN4613517.1 RHS repeat-associated core domain-containing protein [Leifsonia williamsii]